MRASAAGKPGDADLAAIAALLREHFQQPRDEPFAARVLKALDGAPVVELALHAAREIPAMRQKRKAVVSGILLYFAEMIGAARREGAAEREAASNDTGHRASRPLFSVEKLQRMAAGSDPIEREFAKAELQTLSEAGLGV